MLTRAGLNDDIVMLMTEDHPTSLSVVVQRRQKHFGQKRRVLDADAAVLASLAARLEQSQRPVNRIPRLRSTL